MKQTHPLWLSTHVAHNNSGLPKGSGNPYSYHRQPSETITYNLEVTYTYISYVYYIVAKIEIYVQHGDLEHS